MLCSVWWYDEASDANMYNAVCWVYVYMFHKMMPNRIEDNLFLEFVAMLRAAVASKLAPSHPWHRHAFFGNRCQRFACARELVALVNLVSIEQFLFLVFVNAKVFRKENKIIIYLLLAMTILLKQCVYKKVPLSKNEQHTMKRHFFSRSRPTFIYSCQHCQATMAHCWWLFSH